LGFRKSALQRFGFGSVPGLVTLLENLPQDNDQSGHMSKREISFNTDLPEQIRTRADFTYKITPAVISITDSGLGKCSVTEDIEAVLQKIEHWHQGSIARFKILCRDGKGFWHGVRWDGKTASLFALEETDERQACKKLSTKEN